jgi:hypothetical protein
MWLWQPEERWVVISYYIHCLFTDDEKYRQRLNEKFFYGIRDFHPCDVWCPYSVHKPWWNLGQLIEAVCRVIFIHLNNRFDLKLSWVTIWMYVNSMFTLGLHIGQSRLLNLPYGFKTTDCSSSILKFIYSAPKTASSKAVTLNISQN